MLVLPDILSKSNALIIRFDLNKELTKPTSTQLSTVIIKKRSVLNENPVM
jgi:hypothetical protein